MTHEHRWVVFAGPFPQRQNSAEVKNHEYPAIICVGCECGERHDERYWNRNQWNRPNVRAMFKAVGLTYDTTNP